MFPGEIWQECQGKLIHDYDRVDARRVWEVVTTNLPNLLNQLQPLLPKEQEG